MGGVSLLVAGGADAEPAMLTHPVEVEDGSLTGVTELPHSPHGTLPHGKNCIHNETHTHTSVRTERRMHWAAMRERQFETLKIC